MTAALGSFTWRSLSEYRGAPRLRRGAPSVGGLGGPCRGPPFPLDARETGPNRLDERATKSRERLNLPRFFKFAVRIEGVLGVGDKDGPGDDPDVDGAEADPQVHLAPRRTLRSGRRTEGRRDLPAEDVGGA